jgi:hypothetical protein
MAPAAWRGALGLSYHIGPGPGKVHLKVKSDWTPLQPIYDVIAKIPGSAYPDEWVIRGITMTPGLTAPKILFPVNRLCSKKPARLANC